MGDSFLTPCVRRKLKESEGYSLPSLSSKMAAVVAPTDSALFVPGTAVDLFEIECTCVTCEPSLLRTTTATRVTGLETDAVSKFNFSGRVLSIHHLTQRNPFAY